MVTPAVLFSGRRCGSGLLKRLWCLIVGIGGLYSAVLEDTLSIIDNRVQLTLGVRFQQIDVTNFDTTTGATASTYNKSGVTPLVALVAKPWEQVSVYGNYSQALQQGPTAPLTAANANEVFSPFVAKQYEVGVKVDLGRFTTTLAAYQITQPSGITDPVTNVFGVEGEQRHRGLELSVFGELTEAVRLLGGLSYIDAELTKTQGGVDQGNKATLPPFQLALYGEWDLPFLRALTLTSRITHASSQYLDLANTQEIQGWTQLDVGACYVFMRGNGKPITIRFNVDNLFDAKSWYGSTFGSLIARDPRTVLIQATFDF